LTVFEIVVADGLELGPSAKRGFFYFFRKPCAERTWQGRRHRLFSYFFEKILCRAYLATSVPGKAVDKDGF
jgi:hypothetical protein